MCALVWLRHSFYFYLAIAQFYLAIAHYYYYYLDIAYICSIVPFSSLYQLPSLKKAEERREKSEERREKKGGGEPSFYFF